MKIAVFSGELPSTTFIEHLILGISSKHKVLLFGVVKRKIDYRTKTISIYRTPYAHLPNFCLSTYRTLLLLVKRPNDLLNLFKEVSRYKKLYDKWIWYSKFLPIILYKPDVLHLQWARDLEFYTFLKTTFGMKLVVSLRGAHINYTPIVEPYVAEIYKHTFPVIDAFHAVSNAIAKEAHHYKALPERIQVIHSPIPSLFFESFSVWTRKSSNVIKIISIGRFHWKKGFSYTMDAIAKVIAQGFQVEYTIIGSSKLTEALVFQVEQLGLATHIRLKDFMSQGDLIKEIKGHDLLVLPSLEEGIANVVLEAMALGIPVISTNCGGMPEVVIPNETGWLVPVRDAQALADAIVEVSQTSKQEVQRITKNAHDLVRQEFNAEESIQAFLELYEDVLMND
ncbi:colanic acid/amylovoran biosynthesis glycosyltransferase [Flavobacteriaceae bacterium MAR_2010_72]|nr:colanic acid/amylovoran biosynthesis glycosyltransferase [Flavobacteriaceae bacterium MAR_2010_72]